MAMRALSRCGAGDVSASALRLPSPVAAPASETLRMNSRRVLRRGRIKVPGSAGVSPASSRLRDELAGETPALPGLRRETDLFLSGLILDPGDLRDQLIERGKSDVRASG